MKLKIDLEGAIAHHREESGVKLSIQEVINATGIGRQTLHNYTNGKSMTTVENVMKLSKLTGYPLDKIIVEQK